ncbi:MAG: TVP38/TMEM64 family protein [Rhizobiaceae bacterium]
MEHDDKVINSVKPATAPSPLRRFLPLIVLGSALAIGYAFGVQDYLSLAFLGEQRETLLEWVANRPVTSSLAFMAIYSAAVALSLPAASVLTVFAGFLFGWLQGGLMVVVAATAGATILFLAARSGFGGLLKDRLGSKAEAFAQGFREDGFGYLLVLRLAPVFPFFLVNIAPAFFNVKTRDYVLATALGIVPGTFAFAWLGEGVGSVLDAAKASGAAPSISQLVTPQITIAFAVLAVVAAIPLVIKRLRKPPAGSHG